MESEGELVVSDVRQTYMGEL